MSAIVHGDLDYAYARIGARYGARPGFAAWRRIETVRELAAMLDAARATPLRPWTAGLSADCDAHSAERILRAHWRSLAAEVAAWMPQRWRACVEWSAIVPDLPALDHLRDRPQGLAWRDDPVYCEWCERSADASRMPFGALVRARGAAALVEAWRDEWRRRLPEGAEREAPTLSKLGQLVARFAASMRTAPPGDGRAIVAAVRERIEALYRRSTLEPTAAFAYLALAAIDIARLRGEVVRRVLFPRLAPAP